MAMTDNQATPDPNTRLRLEEKLRIQADEISRLELDAREQLQKNTLLQNEIELREQTIASLDNQLNAIKNSFTWKVAEKLRPYVRWISPYGSRRREMVYTIVRTVKPRGQPRSIGLMNWHEYVFKRYKDKRNKLMPPSLSELRCPNVPGLVSIILPAFNGAATIREAIDSILNQTYKQFELIAINDGSTDETGEILEHYAEMDSRVRIIHQENRKIPKTLSRGFRNANGEYLTWTSCDNRLRPDFLEKMVGELDHHKDADFIYANLDIIGEHGEPLRDSAWYSGYQTPRGTEHIHFPTQICMLNTWPNNYVGAAFMYRARVAHLIGDYSKYRYTIEDYDYWMQVNSLLNLVHSDFNDEVYEYRFHSESLTSKDRELGITAGRDRLMVFDDFRRDFYLSPICWIVRNDIDRDDLATRIISELRNKGQLIIPADQIDADSWPIFWQAGILLHITNAQGIKATDFISAPKNLFKVACVTGETGLTESVPKEWDLCIAMDTSCDLPKLDGNYRGWLGISDVSLLIKVVDIKARVNHLTIIESEAYAPHDRSLSASVVICTYHRPVKLRNAIIGVAQGVFAKDEFEILVVNNDPLDRSIIEVLTELRSEYFSSDPSRLRYIECYVPGLSSARNVGIAEAKGQIICFLDDDAVPHEHWLEWIIRSFNEHPDAGVIGGQILLQQPEDPPRWLNKVSLSYWSHYQTEEEVYKEVDNWWEFPWGANWCAKRDALLLIGGFRTRYGRSGDDYGGGEEVIAAALIKKLGFTVGIEPRAIVHHDVSRDRFTVKHIKNTLKSGHLVNYQLQRDLYLPMSTNYMSQLQQVRVPIKQLIGKVIGGNRRTRGFTYMENMFRLAARIRVFVSYVKDKSILTRTACR